MPANELDDRKQTAVLWRATGQFDLYGESVVDEPEELLVRWINKRTQMADGNGNSVSVDAQVIVGEDIPLGSRMWLGELSDWYGTGSAGSGTEAMHVVAFAKTPDIDARFYFRKAGLTRHKDDPDG